MRPPRAVYVDVPFDLCRRAGEQEWNGIVISPSSPSIGPTANKPGRSEESDYGRTELLVSTCGIKAGFVFFHHFHALTMLFWVEKNKGPWIALTK